MEKQKEFTEMTLTFRVHGKPVPKQSFRYTKGGGYRGPRVTAWQEEVKTEAIFSSLEARFERLPKNTPARVELEFHLPDHRRVDVDNLSKAVLDALNGIAWDDDTQVTDLHVLKVIDKASPGVVVTLGAA